MDQPAQGAHYRQIDPVGSSPQLMTKTVLPEVIASGEETETDDEEDRQDQTFIITDPFTRQDLVDQQKADDSLKPLFEAARLGNPEYFVRDNVLYGENLQPKQDEVPYKIVVPTPQRERILQLGHDKSGHFGHKKTKNHISPGRGSVVTFRNTARSVSSVQDTTATGETINLSRSCLSSHHHGRNWQWMSWDLSHGQRLVIGTYLL